MRVRKCCKRVIMLISPMIFLSGCLEFESIEQPSSVLSNKTFTVLGAVTVAPEETCQPYFGIRLPNGWTIQGDAIPYTGVYNGTIIYDSDLAFEQESLSPSPEGYYWWVGAGNKYSSKINGSVHSEFQIQTTNQTGFFSIDYMLGGSALTGINYLRSDNHLIEVVDEYSPRELKAIVEGDTVSLNWFTPFVSEGLIGYDVYRDGQVINTNPVIDTMFIDENPSEELHSYTISSLYDNTDVHFLPYEIKVLVFSGGTGDPNNPYQITRAVQLASFSSADFPHLLDKCFVLVNDIDLDPKMPGGQVFDRGVIAPDLSDLESEFQGTGFTGMFDGNGLRISNLTIIGHDYVGLMGTIHDGGQVKNLGIVDANVVGMGSNIGITVGYNRGDVTNCYSTGSLSGKDNIGGLVGTNEGNLTNCYSTGSVNGNGPAGGLVGRNNNCVVYCYSTGLVSGDRVSGFVGWNDGDVSNSFWDVETSNQKQSNGGVGLTTVEMMDPEFIGLNGWAGHPNWILDSGHDYPHLVWEGTPGQSIPQLTIDWIDGVGTTDDPYEVINADQLALIGKASILWDKHFVLQTDISLVNRTWPLALIPEFSGTFDGDNFTISNLTIIGDYLLGLFGVLREGARIMNLGVVDANVVGTGKSIGIVVGYNHGNVTNCYSTGSVSGYSTIGGLVGGNSSSGVITNCHSSGKVSGDRFIAGLVGGNIYGGEVYKSSSSAGVSGNYEVGGLVGRNTNLIDGCFATGDISGIEDVGGLVGRNSDTIRNCYSQGSVTGVRKVGGLVGYHKRYDPPIIDGCYSAGSVSGNSNVGGLVGFNDHAGAGVIYSFWDIQTSGQSRSQGGTGKTTVEMQTTSTFLGARWDFVDETANGTEDVWWISEGQDYPRLWWELINADVKNPSKNRLRPSHQAKRKIDALTVSFTLLNTHTSLCDYHVLDTKPDY